MSRENREEPRSYNPVAPSYTFNGENTNYNFLLPGTYELKLNNMSANQQPRNPDLNFHLDNEMNTNVLFPNSVLANIPASPARVQVLGNQPGTPRTPNAPPSPVQRGFSNGVDVPPGSHYANIPSAGTPPPGRMNVPPASIQSPSSRSVRFDSPAPRSQGFIYPRTPRS